MSKSKVLVILTGSIAAYKCCHVLSRLIQNNVEIEVVATKSALEFVGAATLEGLIGRKIHSDLYEQGQMMSHIHLARWADIIVCAPATANFINKMAHGIADDLASTLFLAHDFKKPFLIAPAMNTSMYLHPTTQKSIHLLQEMGAEILETASGVLACGEQGYGKLLDPELILSEVQTRLANLQSKKSNTTLGLPANVEIAAIKNTKTLEFLPKKVLITAGGTSEKIDDVRSITNSSTGKTGIQLAQQLSHLGYQVTLLLASRSQYDSRTDEFQVQKFTSFADLQKLLSKNLSETKFDWIFHLAAVSDYSVKEIFVNGKSQNLNKIPSSSDVTLELQLNPKLVNQIKVLSSSETLKLVSFKLTSNASMDERELSVKKLMIDSKSDFVVLNDFSEIKSDQDHPMTIYQNENSQPKKLVQLNNAYSLTNYFDQEIL